VSREPTAGGVAFDGLDGDLDVTCPAFSSRALTRYFHRY
jgi:hypothetical protein